MSIAVQAWVYAHSEARLAERLVLLAIADEADDDGTKAYPSQRRIAEKARLAVNTARAAIDRLEAAGELLVRRPERQGRGHYCEYVVLMGRDPAEVAVEVGWREGSNPEHLSGPKNARERAGTRGNARARADTDPLTPRPIDPDQGQDPRVVRVFDLWRELLDHPRALLDTKRQKRIEWALKNYPEEDVLDAIRGLAASPFHRGDNDSGQKYDDITFVFRDASKVEQFRDRYRNPPRPRGARGGAPPGSAQEFTRPGDRALPTREIET